METLCSGAQNKASLSPHSNRNWRSSRRLPRHDGRTEPSEAFSGKPEAQLTTMVENFLNPAPGLFQHRNPPPTQAQWHNPLGLPQRQPQNLLPWRGKDRQLSWSTGLVLVRMRRRWENGRLGSWGPEGNGVSTVLTRRGRDELKSSRWEWTRISCSFFPCSGREEEAEVESGPEEVAWMRQPFLDKDMCLH